MQPAALSRQSPIFLLFLDCVFQLMVQFPLRFEFSEEYLQTIYEQLLGTLHGDFIHNCDVERAQMPEYFDTTSVWDHLATIALPSWRNVLYETTEAVLQLSGSMPMLELWAFYYGSFHSCQSGLDAMFQILRTRADVHRALLQHRDGMRAELDRLRGTPAVAAGWHSSTSNAEGCHGGGGG